ncbi:MAG: homoserine O-acetyltransferase [Chitinophagales bacterium]|nr:homoserine O-acetyltransferase [Chitinophagales bacterium]
MSSVFTYDHPFLLESGVTLPGYHLAYTTHGQLNETKDNAVWIFHALTANSDPAEWWDGLVGKGKLFDPAKYFIVCVNMPGSCYGSLGPLDENPIDHERHFHKFPFFTTRDMIRAYQPLRLSLGIEKIHIGIGGSMGGQQLLEWAIEEPELFEHIVPLATNAFHSPWGIAFNASQRFCIETDATWKEKNEKAGSEGMKVARSLALLSYRHYDTYWNTQLEESVNKYTDFKSESYQRYQGEKLGKRFNAFSYYFLSKSMDSHNVGRGRGSVEAALAKIKAKTLVIGITTDILFPLSEQRFIAESIPGAQFHSIHSPYGHDGFLLEYEKIKNIITDFLKRKASEEFFKEQITVSN